MKNKRKVAIGLSGGVDSSVSAALLVEQGYDVTGVYLECWRAPGCRTEEDRQDALKIALQLKIPFQVLDFKQAYKDKVVEYFFQEYEAGRTPNPDVMCNKEIKFGLFYDWALRQAQGKRESRFDFVATGHYAGIDSRGKVQGASKDQLFLHTSVDTKKDQTYFLYRLRQEQLSHILFPIGHLTKKQVREEAKKRNLHIANKPDSQGICFIGEINVHNFLKDRLGEKPGDVVNTQGEVMGKHNGLWFYTIGQRHGFEIFGEWKSQQGELRHALPPYYVIGKNPDKNQLIVGFGAEAYRDEFEVEDVHWIGEQVMGNSKQLSDLKVRIRHGGKMIQVSGIKNQDSGGLEVQLAEPVQGIAEGQSAVFYGQVSEQDSNIQLPNTNHQYVCLGGGVIGD